MNEALKGAEVLGYTLVEPIGEGGMAEVWRGEHPTLGTSVAVKVMNPVLARQSDLVGRFQDEAKVQVKLQHPNIVRLENFSLDPLAMLMEYIEGRSLSEVIGREVGAMPVPRALPMMIQILDAVGFAHDNGVVHRDLKPSNVMVDADDKIKVMDFGIAKVLGSSGRTRTGTAMGTPAYMSPEQIKGAKDADHRSDVYALAITFYEMLAGRTPFEASKETDSDFELMDAQVNKVPPDPREFYPAISQAMVDMLMRGLEKAPEGRYQSVAEMRTALLDAAEEQAPASVVSKPTVIEGPVTTPPKRTATVVEESGPSEGENNPARTVAPPPVDSVGGLQGAGQWTSRKPLIAAAVGGGSILLVVLALVVGGSKEDNGDLESSAVEAPNETVQPDPVPVPSSTPSAPSVHWYCLCYAEKSSGSPEPATACRSTREQCLKLQKLAARGIRSFVANSVTRTCQHFYSAHPGDALGGRDLWIPSSRAGAWWSKGQCLIP